MSGNMNHGNGMFGNVHMLVMTADRKRKIRIMRMLERSRIPAQYLLLAEKASVSGVMDMMGFGDEEQVVSICFLPEHILDRLLINVKRQLSFGRQVKTVMFSVPLNGLSIPGGYREKENYKEQGQYGNQEQYGSGKQYKNQGKYENQEKYENQKKYENQEKYGSQERYRNHHIHQWMGREVADMNRNIEYDLVVVITNKGNGDRVIEKARSAGAAGGTMIHALRFGPEDIGKFFDFPIQSPKDIISMLVSREKKEDVVMALHSRSGEEIEDIIFSLPADNVYGI